MKFKNASPMTINQFTVDVEVFKRHSCIIGGSGSGKTTLALRILEDLLMRGIPVVMIDRKGDLSGYADLQNHNGDFWKKFYNLVDVNLYTPGRNDGKSLRMDLLPEVISDSVDEKLAMIQQISSSIGEVCEWKSAKDQKKYTLLSKMIEHMLDDNTVKSDKNLLNNGIKVDYISARQYTEGCNRRDALKQVTSVYSLENLIRHCLYEGNEFYLKYFSGAIGPKAFKSIAEDLSLAKSKLEHIFNGNDVLNFSKIFNRTGKQVPLTIISTRYLSGVNSMFWLNRFFNEMTTWMNRNPSGDLQGVVFLDEADIYMPANRNSGVKVVLEGLLRRGRSGGLGMLLATQSPGDMDYKCRENIRSWFIGLLKEVNSLGKIDSIVGDFKHEVSRLCVGEFIGITEGHRGKFKGELSKLTTMQYSEDEILGLSSGVSKRIAELRQGEDIEWEVRCGCGMSGKILFSKVKVGSGGVCNKCGSRFNVMDANGFCTN